MASLSYSAFFNILEAEYCDESHYVEIRIHRHFCKSGPRAEFSNVSALEKIWFKFGLKFDFTTTGACIINSVFYFKNAQTENKNKWK